MLRGHGMFFDRLVSWASIIVQNNDTVVAQIYCLFDISSILFLVGFIPTLGFFVGRFFWLFSLPKVSQYVLFTSLTSLNDCLCQMNFKHHSSWTKRRQDASGTPRRVSSPLPRNFGEVQKGSIGQVWKNLYGGFLKWRYPQIIHFSGIVLDKTTMGVPPFSETTEIMHGISMGFPWG